MGIIAYSIIKYNNYNNYKKKCIPIKDSDRIIISNLECISVIFEFIYTNPDLETDIVKVFMETFNPLDDPNKENFNNWIFWNKNSKRIRG